MVIGKRRLSNKHKDIIWMILMCVVAVATNFVFEFGEVEKISYKVVALCVGIFLIAICLLRNWLSEYDYKLVRNLGLLGIFMVIYTYLLGKFRADNISSINVMICLCLSFCLIALFFLWRFWKDYDKNDNVVYYVLFLAFLIRFCFFTMSNYDIAQNDVGVFSENFKHLGYIHHIFMSGKLPEDNPMLSDQFCHPLLHHLISALYLKFCYILGFEQEIWVENLQTLPFIYSNLSLLILDKIARVLKINVNGRTIVLILTAFIPYNTMLSGALNNDALLFLMMLLSIYFTLKWYEEPKLCWIAYMAFSIGLAMMTKISGVLIAPAMAFVMIYKLCERRNARGDLLRQFIVFGFISFPLGLWYPVLRYIQFKMPLGFVVRLPIDSYQYIGNYKLWKRFFDFSDYWKSPYLCLQVEKGYIDHNIFTGLIKTALFAEADFSKNSDLLRGVSWFGLVVMSLTLIGLFVGFVAFLKDRKICNVIKIFIMCLIGVIFTSWIFFCLDCPHVCTMHIRYVWIAIYVLALVAGMQISNRKWFKQRLLLVKGMFLLYCGTFMLLILSIVNEMQGSGSF